MTLPLLGVVLLTCGQAAAGDPARPTTAIVVAGTYEDSAVHAEMYRVRSHFRYCNESWAAKSEQTEGALQIEFGLDESGNPKDLRVSQEGNQAQVFTQCIAGVVKKRKFHPPQGKDVRVRYRLAFTAATPDGFTEPQRTVANAAWSDARRRDFPAGGIGSRRTGPVTPAKP